MNRSMLHAAKTPSLQKIADAVRSNHSIAVSGLSEDQAAFIASALADNEHMRVMVVYATELKAMHAAEDIHQLLHDGAACMPGGEIDLTRGASSHDGAWSRLDAMARMTDGSIRVLSTSMDALMQRMGPVSTFREASFTLTAGDQIAPDKLMRRLVELGYERMPMVEGKGQCALRGSILDVYPPTEPYSLRIEFFDDEIDHIRAFDYISQRSLERVPEARITPATEVLLPAEDAEAAAQRMRGVLSALSHDAPHDLIMADLPPIPDDDDELVDYYDANVAPKAAKKAQSVTRETELEHRQAALLSDADLVENGQPFRRIRFWLPVLVEKTTTLADWFEPDAILLVEPDLLRNRAKERIAGFTEDLNNAIERGEAVREQQELLMDWPILLPELARIPLVSVTDMLRSIGGVKVQDAVNLACSAPAGYAGQLRTLAKSCQDWLDHGYTIALLTGSVARGQRLQQTLDEEFHLTSTFIEDGLDLPENRLCILPATLTFSMVWDEAKLALVCDTAIFGSGYRKSKSRRNTGEKIAAFTDLKPGDFVVHEDHGVGLYQGTVHMQNEGAFRDYLLIQYAGNDKLYVPIEQLARIQRYIGNPNQAPKLNRIGGGEWSRQKGKVKEGLKKLAFDLVALYAKRQKSEGHAFGRDTHWQREFEDMFPYELTPDQAQSVHEITLDMESPRNMDRLLCGDVGYGKTEVSLRAAFKAVMDSKQVAILAPTTILAQQHYNTVLKRFAGFPVTVEVLSRFRTAKEQKKILADAAAGKIDILIGTHRLLAKDVKFKDLGLLIVDEEQRFGVAHKEIIKNMKSQVDVLTLSATPIPRTLHMSMVGIRDMSVLETPPEERLPVQTHVVEYSDTLIRDAILREISRGGQVYFLYNRVKSIERFYQRLRALVPEARIGVAHGQMRENGLEDVMMDFYAGSYDVLLCTTIIESGLDVPTANTLIVFDAERFGLSQLYQLRGRVGRSSRQAYAYFTVRQDKLLSETAQQRLSAIREFTEFGSGFRIAMRDLEIRGAGNILGPEQHGHLATVGYEMYCKLIQETVAEVQGKATENDLETRVGLKVDAFLPEKYIKDSHQRMEMLRRIGSLSSDEDREDILDELIDRFGPMPDVVESLLNVSQMRYLCNAIGIRQVTKRQDKLTFIVEDRYVTEPMLLLQALKVTDPRLTLSTNLSPSIIQLNAKFPNDLAMLNEGLKVMRSLTGRYRDLIQVKQSQAAANA